MSSNSKNRDYRIVPVTLKIVIVFTLSILVSNISSNYINLQYNRAEHVNLMNNLLVKDLKPWVGRASQFAFKN